MKAKDIIKVLHDVRKVKHITQEQVGQAIGVCDTQIGVYERNTCSLQMNRIIEWADKLGMKIVLKPKNK